MGDQAGTRYAPAEPNGVGHAERGPENPPFHAQLEYLSQTPAAVNQHVDGRDQQPFDMRHMVGSLPSSVDQMHGGRRPSFQYNVPPGAPGMINPASLHLMQQPPPYGPQLHDPAMFARVQQSQPHQYPAQQYGAQRGHFPPGNRPHPVQLQTHTPFAGIEPYPYPVNHSAFSPMDMRFPQHASPAGYGMHASYTNMPHPPRRDSEPMAIPSFPRGPPRKPKQSGHALWVGNLPPAATVTDLKDHFSREATKEIESLFLMSKSNCAFVNYRSEAACVAAMNRFHDSRFHGVRLVCRLRRGSTSTVTAIQESQGTAASDPTPNLDETTSDKISGPTIVDGNPNAASARSEEAAHSASPAANKMPEKFFVVKSLTLQDLEASVRNGIWATQSHNEAALNRAFEEAENVYLIFSANKSGEYFGYARMKSAISGEPMPIASIPIPQTPTAVDGPKSIPTPATETAPRGRIVDDSGRGTIFWEAELSDSEGEVSPSKENGESGANLEMGRPFKIEWISTTRLPFYRTRGLRNPWNANREVKIARDGTELEPSVGKRLVQMFHHPAQATMPPAGISFYMG